MKIALLQTTVTRSKVENLREVEEFCARAGNLGADAAILPEMFSCPYETEAFSGFSEEAGGETYQVLSRCAKENQLLLIGGSFPERDGTAIYNSSFVFSPDGTELARHRKVHLFDIDISGKQSFRESDTFTAGDHTTVFTFGGHTFGLAICFDIRFPELFRSMALQGAELIFVPAAFNMTTGPLHWELAFRSRAVDNQVFTVGCAPARARNGRYVSYANSLICDPWGTVLINAGEDPCVCICDVDLSLVPSVRSQLPILSARRTDLYLKEFGGSAGK